MKNAARFRAALNFAPVDRLPVLEWAPYWDLTVDRWHEEGLPASLQNWEELQDYFELDPMRQLWVWPYKPGAPEVPKHCPGFVKDRKEYLDFKKLLYPDPPFDPEEVEPWLQAHKDEEVILWFTLHGFYWFPREILGVEHQMFAFYDQPDLLREINDDLLAFNLKALELTKSLCRPDFMTVAEDMSYHTGPMLSKQSFDEFLMPCYQPLVPELKAGGMITLVDSDGNVMPLLPWTEQAGFEGTLPLERNADNDLQQIRRDHPRAKLIGGFNKLVMNQGENAMRAEFENLLPIMSGGGYVPGVDHQTPPAVSLQDYQLYLSLLREYCDKAVK
ncbi:hypothetical protein GF407_11895 [candidate division KSB1 bacterium]|nr:hypothetical protein [candidate division KSB1 bacterium]